MNMIIKGNLKIFNKISAFVFLILLLTGCAKELSNEDMTLNPARSLKLENERYGTATRQVADIYLPANRNANTKILIILHGGSWGQGDKTDINTYIDTIRDQWPELAIVNMNYRLANGTPANAHPAQMEDIEDLITYIKSKRNTWIIGDEYGISGVSAGGHLALLFSYAFDFGDDINVVASIVGPTDFSDPLYTSSPLFQVVAANLLGSTWAQSPELHRSVSPALLVTPAVPPTFMAYGLLDQVVPISNATTLRGNLIAENVTHTYIEYQNEEHELSETAVADLIPKLISFLKVHL